MAAGQRVLLVGPPGCAKTARIAAAAAENGRRLVVMRASLSERVDFGGALVPDMAAGVTRALPLEVLRDLQTTTEPTLLFQDDLGQAPIDVQAALMRLFDDGALSPNVLIWGATNRPGDVAGVTRLCEPLRSRFHLAFGIPTPESTDQSRDADGRLQASGPVMLGTWADEVDGWCNWAMDTGAAPEIIAWHRSTSGRTLYAWQPSADPALRMPDFRSWETVIRLWQAGLQDLPLVSAAIGKPAAAEFLAFARLAHQLPTPDQVWADPDNAPVPTDSAALYLVTSMLAAAMGPSHVDSLVAYLSRLPRVYGALLARDVHHKLGGGALSGSRSWVTWFTENQELFAVGA
jgi:hypothetical protein